MWIELVRTMLDSVESTCDVDDQELSVIPMCPGFHQQYSIARQAEKQCMGRFFLGWGFARLIPHKDRVQGTLTW